MPLVLKDMYRVLLSGRIESVGKAWLSHTPDCAHPANAGIFTQDLNPVIINYHTRSDR